MQEADIKDAIAVREFDLRDGGKVHAFLWAPVLQSTGEYRCFYLIKGLGSEKIRAGHGVDSMQALVLTLNQIAMHLYLSEEYKDGSLTWCDSRSLGIPVGKYMRADTPDED
ncbi:MAG: DUF6968 family protein [Asticcacaulis sp.]